MFNPNRSLTPGESRQLRFISPRSDPKPLFFEPGTDRLDRQATRGVRELTPESAAILERIIQRTDKTSKAARSTYVKASIPDNDLSEGNAQKVLATRVMKEILEHGKPASNIMVQSVPFADSISKLDMAK